MEKEKTPCLVAYEAYGPKGGHKKRWSTDFVCVSCQVLLPHETQPVERDIWFPTREHANDFVDLIKRVCEIEEVEIFDFTAPDKKSQLAGSCVDVKYNEGHFPTGTVVLIKDDLVNQCQAIVCGMVRTSADELKLYLSCTALGFKNTRFNMPVEVECVQRIMKAGTRGYQYNHELEEFFCYDEEKATMEHYIVKSALQKLRDRHYYDVDAILDAIGKKVRRWSHIEQRFILDVSYVNQFLKKNRLRFRLSLSEVRNREKARELRQAARFKEVLERLQTNKNSLVDKKIVSDLAVSYGVSNPDVN